MTERNKQIQALKVVFFADREDKMRILGAQCVYTCIMVYQVRQVQVCSPIYYFFIFAAAP